MTSYQNSVYQSLRPEGDFSGGSTLRYVSCVHVLNGLLTFAIGVVSAALYVYLGWLCVGIWTGISFVICGVLSVTVASKLINSIKVTFIASLNVMTLNIACTGAVITFSSLFPGSHFYDSAGSKETHSISHNQTTGTALAILYLVVSVIETVVCVTAIIISMRVMAGYIQVRDLRPTRSYDEPYISSGSFSAPTSLEARRFRRTSENATPPPDYEVATHNLSTSPGSNSTVRRYGSLSETEPVLQQTFTENSIS